MSRWRLAGASHSDAVQDVRFRRSGDPHDRVGVARNGSVGRDQAHMLGVPLLDDQGVNEPEVLSEEPAVGSAENARSWPL